MKIVGRKIDFAAGVPLRDAASWYFHRGLFPAVRGLRLCDRAAAGGPTALGRRVRIHSRRHLHLGRGVVIGDDSWLSCYSLSGVHLADRVTIREFAWLQCSSSLRDPGVGLWVGSDTYIGPRASLGIGGRVTIGARCDIGGSFTLVAENHVVLEGTEALRGSGRVRQGIVIADDCWFGNNVTILDGVHVGQGAVIGAGAIVTKSVPAHTVVAGNPARVLRSRLPTG